MVITPLYESIQRCLTGWAVYMRRTETIACPTQPEMSKLQSSVIRRPAAAPAVSSSAHVVLTALLGIVVTALSCFAFYVFRTMAAREQSFTDALKVIRSATEIVASLAERGIPGLRSRVDDLESRSRVLEQYQRRTSSDVTRLASATSQAMGGPALTPPTASAAEGVADEAALLAARRAARAATAH